MQLLVYMFFICAGKPFELPEQDILHYDLSLDVDISGELLECINEITFVAHHPDSALDLHLIGFEVDSVECSLGELNYSRLGDTLSIALPEGIDPGDTCSVEIWYHGHPLAYSGLEYMIAGVTFVDGCMCSVGMEPGCGGYLYPCIDIISEKASYTFHITVDRGFWGIANGSLTGIDETGERLTYHWDHPEDISTYLAAVAVGEFELLEDPEKDWICHWISPDMNQDGRDALARTGDIVKLYEGLFCPYPWSGGLGCIEVAEGGNEHNTKIYISPLYFHYSADLALGVLVHEIAHHWWGNYVTEAEWSEIWLAESFATYSETLWLEEEFGPDSAHARLRRDLEGYFWSGETAPIVPAKGYLWTHTVYNKGSFVLGMLRRTVGDKAFFDALKLYLSRHAFGSATTDDFRRAVEDASGLKLNWFFDQWVYGHGYPCYDLDYSIDTLPMGGAEVAFSLNQTQPDYWPTFRTSIELLASDSTSDTLVTIMNDSRIFTDTLRLTFIPDSIVLDPEGHVLASDSSGVREPFHCNVNMVRWVGTEPIYIIPTAEADTAIQKQIWEYVEEVRDRFNPEAMILTDREVLSAGICEKTLFVYGTPVGNLWLRKFFSELPFLIKPGVITAGERFTGTDLRLIASWNHPENLQEHVVIYTSDNPADIVHINGLYHGRSCFTIGRDSLVLATGSYITSDTSFTEILLDSLPQAPSKRTVR